MTVKELKAILARVKNEDIEVSYYDYGNREINGFYYVAEESKPGLVLTNLSVQPRVAAKDEV